MANVAIVQAQEIVKRYDGVTAVDGISFEMAPGECFGLPGPNGAGKTSTLRMISCVSPLSGGELWVDGMSVRQSPRRIKSILGVVPQDDSLDPDLTVWQNLLVYARYFGIPKAQAHTLAEEALNFLQLLDKADVAIDALSGGMKRRLLIARALINQPKIVILDEPTTGLDPQAKHLLWQKMRQLKAQGVTMLLSTHNMEEAAHLCDRLVIMNQGRILAEGEPSELVEQHVGHSALELHVDAELQEKTLARALEQPGLTVEAAEDIIYVFSCDSTDRLETGELVPEGTKMVYRPANLEDVFLRLTGRGLIE